MKKSIKKTKAQKHRKTILVISYSNKHREDSLQADMEEKNLKTRVVRAMTENGNPCVFADADNAFYIQAYRVPIISKLHAKNLISQINKEYRNKRAKSTKNNRSGSRLRRTIREGYTVSEESPSQPQRDDSPAVDAFPVTAASASLYTNPVVTNTSTLLPPIRSGRSSL